MQVLEKISVFVGKHMAVIVLVIAALSLFCPKTALWVQTGWINYLLMLVMFGMGLTLKTEDFKYVFQHPRNILLGCISQFTIMPLLAYGLGMAFQLDTALLAGVILVGTCPGHAASGVRSWDGIPTGHSIAGRSNPGGDLSGRHFQQCDHVSCRR